KRDLDKLLSTTLKGDGFTLHYRKAEKPKLATGVPVEGEAPAEETENEDVDARHKASVLRLFRDAEFHVTELKALLAEPALPHVDIYVYPNEDRKKLWFGGGATDVTDVRTPSIHITADGWPHPTLRHELVHALTSDIAFHGLGFHPNIAFTEG